MWRWASVDLEALCWEWDVRCLNQWCAKRGKRAWLFILRHRLFISEQYQSRTKLHPLSRIISCICSNVATISSWYQSVQLRFSHRGMMMSEALMMSSQTKVHQHLWRLILVIQLAHCPTCHPSPTWVPLSALSTLPSLSALASLVCAHHSFQILHQITPLLAGHFTIHGLLKSSREGDKKCLSLTPLLVGPALTLQQDRGPDITPWASKTGVLRTWMPTIFKKSSRTNRKQRLQMYASLVSSYRAELTRGRRHSTRRGALVWPRAEFTSRSTIPVATFPCPDSGWTKMIFSLLLISSTMACPKSKSKIFSMICPIETKDWVGSALAHTLLDLVSGASKYGCYLS